MAQNKILNVAHASPFGIKTNCYTFALGPRVGHLGYAERKTKAQPGERCNVKEPLPFHNRQRAARALSERVHCDNPTTIVRPLSFKRAQILYAAVPKGYHLMAAILGADDYHFLRRVSRQAVLRDPHFTKSLKDRVRASPHRYIWAHVRGWSNGVKLVDAARQLVVSPVPKEANLPFRVPRADFTYGQISYDTFVGLWLVRSRAAKVGVSSNPIQRNVVNRALKNRI